MQSSIEAHNTLNGMLQHRELSGGAFSNHRYSVSQSMDQPNRSQYAIDYVEPQAQAPEAGGVDPDSGVTLVTGPSPLSSTASAGPSGSNHTNPRPVFVIAPNARDLAAVKREMSRTSSIKPTENLGAAGTRCLGPIHIRKLPAVAGLVNAAARYKFQFLIEELRDPLIFTYSTSDDLIGAIEDFILDFDLDQDLITPIRMGVEAELGEAHQVAWQLSVGAPSTGPIYTIATTSAVLQKPSNVPQSFLNSKDWMHHRTFHDDIDFYHAQYTPFTRALRLTYGQTLRELNECPATLEAIGGQTCRKFSTTDFLKLAFEGVVPYLTEAIFAQAATKMVSVTLVTVAWMLHVGGTNCPCDVDNFFDEEEFQIELWKRRNTVLPPTQHLKPQLHNLRVRYVFALLESAISAMEQPLERLIPELVKTQRSRKVYSASYCLWMWSAAIMRILYESGPGKACSRKWT